MSSRRLAAALFIVASALPGAAGPENVLVVVNQKSELSRKIGQYYATRRSIPPLNVCFIQSTAAETIDHRVYEQEIAQPVAQCLRSRRLVDKILYVVTTMGVPLRVDGSGGIEGDQASVDSELALLWPDIATGHPHSLAGPLPNPFFGRRETPFSHPRFPIYLVTRLAGYDWPDIQGLIDRAQQAQNRGKIVIDLNNGDNKPGNDWLRAAALFLPPDRVVFDESPKVIHDQSDVIAWASWGSNDASRNRRASGFRWLPGAIMTEYVSTDARTFERPPATWNISSKWDEPKLMFFGSAQSLIGDYIHEGVTGASGHVFEPYLQFTPRPDHLLPAYLAGRTLAESYYLAIPALSWKNIVVGDPLCRLR